jgi:VWFA-related protein
MLAHAFGGELIGCAPEILYRAVRSSRYLQAEVARIFARSPGLASREVAATRMPENASISADRARVAGILQHGIALDAAESSGDFGSAVVASELEQWEAYALKVGLPNDVFVREAEGSAEDMANIFTAVEHLRYLPGEKHLVFFTEFGLLFPFGNVEYDDYISHYAADARVAIDTFQTGGLDGLILRSPSLNKALRSGKTAPGTAWAQSVMVSTIRNVSEQTGGRAAVFENVGPALSRASNAARFQYLLGYYPKEESWDGRYRQIDVKVNRPGVKVYFRHGYFAKDPVTSSGREEERAVSRVADASASILKLSDVDFDAAAATEADEAGRPQLRVNLRIKPATVAFHLVDGRHTAKLRIALFYADAGEKLLGQDAKTLDLRLRNEAYQEYLQSAIPFSTLIPLNPKARFLKVVVYDIPGDRSGSKVIEIR